MPVVPPSMRPGPASDSEKHGNAADQPEALTAGARTKTPFDSDEMALLLAFFELLQQWDQDQKIV